ncbi:MAG: cytochrome P450 [Cyanobacteria bacterium J06648_10]
MQTIQKPTSSAVDPLPNSVKRSRLSQLINWLSRPYDYLDECAEKYGETFTMHIFGFDKLVFLSNPQAIKEIFADNGTRFDTGRGQGLIQPLLGDNSLILLDGDRHKRERKLLMPPFHGGRVRSYADTICDITQELSDHWQPGQQILAGDIMPDITLEVILQTVFGLREGDRYQQLKSLIISWLDLTGSPAGASMLFFRWFQKDLGPWSPWGKFVRQRQQIRGLLQDEINERREKAAGSKTHTPGEDMLSLMMLARDEAGEPMTDEELKDELITMLAAGHETTAAALCWAMYWIHKLPHVKAKLMAELQSVDGNVDDTADALQIASLPYLTAVASETLRMYPIAPVVAPRISSQTVTIGGRTYPPETFLTPAIYSVHHREDLYPDSKTFRPERFIERQFAPYEFLPFGGGNRRCIGYALAKLELNLVLATLLRARSFKLATDEPVTPLRRGVVIATSNGVPLTVEA